MSDPRLSCPICLRREAGLIPAPRHVATWDELNGPEQMAMLAEVGSALGRETPGFVASSAHGHFHLREASGSRLTTGGRDPFLPLLAERLDTAQSVDLAIAFAMDSGVALLEPWFRELLARGGRLRIVVGDYLDTTDPTALARLLDLEGAELFVFETGGLSFHPKAWLFRAADARGAAIVGSSNLSHSALTEGVEWNLHSEDAADSVAAAFEDLMARPEVKPLTAAWIDAYAKRRRTRPMAIWPIRPNRSRRRLGDRGAGAECAGTVSQASNWAGDRLLLLDAPCRLHGGLFPRRRAEGCCRPLGPKLRPSSKLSRRAW